MKTFTQSFFAQSSDKSDIQTETTSISSPHMEPIDDFELDRDVGCTCPLASASQSAYCVAATLRLNNYTPWHLQLESCHLNYGQTESVIHTVRPGAYSIMAMHKTGGSTSGTSGTIAWRLEGRPTSVILMWSVPYNQNHHSNWLGVGVGERGRHSAETFQEMYYGEETYFSRKDFYRLVDPVLYANNGVTITGVMGTAHKTDIVVDVRLAAAA
ncbi:tereporin-Ca1-like [Paramacrobiotus metropolitanus]|uniref:tereporin-Ca1-like n=1 Tax=Paramacrobiotus metropolitanus TaxID=2943436 RepID=UPI00244649D4|nr:tereporin-Ca1-like [Paramacrobiotus metropolitanus]